MQNLLHDAAQSLEKYMETAIESAAKTEAGDPIWQLKKVSF